MTRKTNFDRWCEEVMAHADKTTNGLFNWRNVPFNWAERYSAGDLLPTAADALVVAAWEESQKLFSSPLFKAAA